MNQGHANLAQPLTRCFKNGNGRYLPSYEPTIIGIDGGNGNHRGKGMLRHRPTLIKNSSARSVLSYNSKLAVTFIGKIF